MMEVNKKIKQKINNIVCLILCFNLIISLFVPMMVVSASGSQLRNSTYVVDSDTTDDYINRMINDTNGSRYAGRIWTDKTVLRNSIKLNYNTDGYTGTIANNSDFLHVFSALGSSQAWIGLSPTKTVIVIDNSGSMYSGNNWENTRMAKTIKAVNSSIDELMRAGDYNEVSVVVFGNGSNNGKIGKDHDTAVEVLKMGHYEVSGSHDNPYQYLDAGWIASNQAAGTFTPQPLKVTTGATTGSGYVYVDKRYVNGQFKVDESIEESASGERRYDAYANGSANINAGVNVAFSTLLKEETTVKVAGMVLGYIPSVVVLSDGAATDMLKGTYSKPEMDNRGFTNDRGVKNASYIGVFHENTKKNTADWNMYMEIKDKDGTKKFEQVGYGGGQLSNGLKVGSFSEEKGSDWSATDNTNPDEEGVKGMKKFAEEVRSTQGAMILQTILNGAYMKAAVEKRFNTDCKFYTVSVDIGNPEEIKLPSKDEFVVSNSNNINTSFVVMNPNKYFNLEWLKEKGYITNKDANLENLNEKDFIYNEYTVGSEIILGIRDAIGAWNEVKKNSSSKTYRDRLKNYVVYSEVKGLYNDMKNNSVNYDGKTYTATSPIGPNHSNAYLIKARYTDLSYPNLVKDDKSNPYNITSEDLDFNYVNAAYYTSSAAEAPTKIAEAFDSIVEKIKEPTFNPVYDDFSYEKTLSFSNPIGKYMEVKDVKNLLLFGKLYDIEKTDVKYVVIEKDKEKESSTKPSKYDYKRQYYQIKNKENNKLVNECYKVIDEGNEYPSKVTFKLSDIEIYVDTKLNAGPLENDQTLYVEIPSTALPLQVVSIKLNPDGSSAFYQTNVGDKKESTPLRLFYEVGLSDDILINNKKDIDLSKISVEYKEKYTENDILSFNSNYYSNTLYTGYIADTQEEAITKGDSVLSFSPSIENRYYIFQENLKLYNYAYIVDEGGNVHKENNPLLFEGAVFDGEYAGQTEKDQPNSTAKEAIKKAYSEGKLKKGDIIVLKGDVVKYGTNPKSEDFYYFAIDYYMPTSDGKGKKVQYVVARRGSEFGSGILQEEGNIIPKGDFLSWIDENGKNSGVYNFTDKIPENQLNNGSNWVLVTKVGGLRIGDLHQGILIKTKNKTNTSKSYYLPVIAHANSSNGSDVILSEYLGNNGLITYKYIFNPNTSTSIIVLCIAFFTVNSILLLVLLYRKKYLKKNRFQN